MKKILYFIIVIFCSCKNNFEESKNLIGSWEIDSLSMNGLVVKGELVNSEKFSYSISFYKDSTYSLYHGKNKQIISKGNWSKNKNSFRIFDQKKVSLECVFLSGNAIKLTYNDINENTVANLYFTKSACLLEKETKTTELQSKHSVSGFASYPSDGIPDYINVYAKNINSNEIFQHRIFDRKEGTFEIDLPNGNFYIFSSDSKVDYKTPNTKLNVIVNNRSLKNITAQDLYISKFNSIEQTEVENENTSIFTYRLLEDLTDLETINPGEIEAQIKSFDKKWNYVPKYNEINSFAFAKQNEILIIITKGIANTLSYSFIDDRIYDEINQQLHMFTDLNLFKTESNEDYEKKYYKTPFHSVIVGQVKEGGVVYGFSIQMIKLKK